MKEKTKSVQYATFEAIHNNILLVKFNSRPSKGDFDKYLAELKRWYSEVEESMIVIFDARKARYVSSNLRHKQAQWIKENKSLIREKLILVIYVIDNPVIKFVLEAIFLLHKSPVPFEIVKTRDDAESTALEYFEVNTL